MVMHRFSFNLAPEDPPINVTAIVVPGSNATSEYIVIEWEPVPEDGKLNGRLRAYNISWRLARENAAGITEKSINIPLSETRRRRRRSTTDAVSNERRLELRDLKIYTNYSVKVAAVTIKVGKFSDPVYFYSQEGGMR